MMLSIDEYKPFIANAHDIINKHMNNMKRQKSCDKFEFAEIGDYVPSDEEKEQMRRLAEIQEKANKEPFNNKVRF